MKGLDLAAPVGRLPLLSFYARRIGDAERALWLLRCLDEACSPGTIVKLLGTMVSAATANGRPLVAWTDIAQGQAYLTPCDSTAIRRNGFEHAFDGTPATLGAD